MLGKTRQLSGVCLQIVEGREPQSGFHSNGLTQRFFIQRTQQTRDHREGESIGLKTSIGLNTSISGRLGEVLGSRAGPAHRDRGSPVKIFKVIFETSIF